MGEISNARSEPRPDAICFKGRASHKDIIAYGVEPGAAQRLDPHKRIWLEQAPTLRAKAGDNQVAVAICRSNEDRDI